VTSTELEKKKKAFLKLTKSYEEIKPKLSDFEKYSIEFQLRRIKFEVNHPGSKYYIGQNMEPRKGLLKSNYCKLCSQNLEELRKYNPRRRFINFCSPNCRKEHNRRRKIYEKELGEKNTTFLMWNHPISDRGEKLPLQRKDMVYFSKKGNTVEEHPYKARKSKWAKT